MTLPIPNGESVIRLRAGSTFDSITQENVSDWSQGVTSETIKGCAFADVNPNGLSFQADRTVVVTQPTLYAPVFADIMEGDRLIIRGRKYDVDGRPMPWVNPFNNVPVGLEVKLTATDGVPVANASP